MQQAGMLGSRANPFRGREIAATPSALEQFIGGKSFDGYVADSMLRSGVERQLEIIGEALNQPARHDPDVVAIITDCRRIIALRNILVHGYARVDHQVIWNIVERSLPVLRREIDALMRGP